MSGLLKLNPLWQLISQFRPLPPPGNPEGGSGHAGISVTFPHISPLTARAAYRSPVGARSLLSRTSRRTQDRRASTRAFWGALSSRPPPMRLTYPRVRKPVAHPSHNPVSLPTAHPCRNPTAPTSGALLPCKAVLLTPSNALPSKAPLSVEASPRQARQKYTDNGKSQLRKLPDPGETRQESEIAHRAVLAVAHRLLPRLEEVLRLAR